MDNVDAKSRSEIMARVKSRNTEPELALRRMLHREGLRYRLHVVTLPGRPDIVFPRLRKVVFVNGCFWHGHRGCRKGRLPKSNVAFWRSKILENRRRDLRNVEELGSLGWSALTVWQCELQDLSSCLERVLGFLRERDG